MNYDELQNLMDTAWRLANKQYPVDSYGAVTHQRQIEIFEELGGDYDEFYLVVVNGEKAAR